MPFCPAIHPTTIPGVITARYIQHMPTQIATVNPIHLHYLQHPSFSIGMIESLAQIEQN